MKLRDLLIALTGVFLLSSGLFAGNSAQASDQPPRQDVRQDWNVRRAQYVLDKNFGEKRFKMHITDHFVMLYDTDDRRVAVRAALLEETYNNFFNAFGAFCDGLSSADHPLVCVLFSNRSDFAKYARQVDWLDMSWSGGYYSSRTNRMALYDARPPQPTAADTTKEAQDNVRQASASQDEAPRLKLLSSASEAGASPSPPLNLASTTHEAAHQLAFNSGLQNARVMYPMWVSEGLACAFESTNLNQTFGLGRLNQARLYDLRQAAKQNRLATLKQFICVVRPPTHDPQQLNATYAQAWAVFRFFYLENREALSDYLHALAKLPAGVRDTVTLRAEFEKAFGPVEVMERQWQTHLQGLVAKAPPMQLTDRRDARSSAGGVDDQR